MGWIFLDYPRKRPTYCPCPYLLGTQGTRSWVWWPSHRSKRIKICAILVLWATWTNIRGHLSPRFTSSLAWLRLEVQPWDLMGGPNGTQWLYGSNLWPWLPVSWVGRYTLGFAFAHGSIKPSLQQAPVNLPYWHTVGKVCISMVWLHSCVVCTIYRNNRYYD